MPPSKKAKASKGATRKKPTRRSRPVSPGKSTAKQEGVAAPRVAEAANRKAGTSEDQERRSESRKAAARSRELQAKIAELETANNDLHNLLASSDIATVCLDWALHIKWFTPATRAMLNVIATDVGRPIRDLASPLAGESLLHDAGWSSTSWRRCRPSWKRRRGAGICAASCRTAPRMTTTSTA
jgi:hypothetical protein